MSGYRWLPGQAPIQERFAALFAQALSGPAGFDDAAALAGGLPGRLMLLVLAWALLHHLLAGLRHLALDLGWGLQRAAARRSAWTALSGALLLTLLGAGALL